MNFEMRSKNLKPRLHNMKSKTLNAYMLNKFLVKKLFNSNRKKRINNHTLGLRLNPSRISLLKVSF